MTSPAWALITGASSGIGECFARALAARGRNLVLVACSTRKLEGMATQLGLRCNVHVEPTYGDRSKPGQATWIAAALGARGLSVNLLVNNPGFGARGRFWELPVDRSA